MADDSDLVSPDRPDPFDPLEQVVQRRVAEKQRQAISISEVISGGNPDQYASHLRLASKLGVPVEAVEALPDRAQSLAKAKEISALFPSYKVTGNFIRNPGNMRLVSDDLETLRQTESIWGDIKQSGAAFAKSIGMIGAGASKATALIGYENAKAVQAAADRIDRGAALDEIIPQLPNGMVDPQAGYTTGEIDYIRRYAHGDVDERA